jgi:hypothetical protein
MPSIMAANSVVALALVLHQRVALRDRPQADAVAQVVHLVQVLAPHPVDTLRITRRSSSRMTSEPSSSSRSP